ncbi:MAG: hypothetical protein U0835_12215 [Isosphaeraceae bacterium]
MLKGFRARRRWTAGAQELSTYGILPEFSQQELTRLLDALGRRGAGRVPRGRTLPPGGEPDRGGLGLPQEHPGPRAEPGPAARPGLKGADRRPRPTVALDPLGRPSPAPLDEEPPRPTPTTSPATRSWKAPPCALALAREAKQPAYCIFTNHPRSPRPHAR